MEITTVDQGDVHFAVGQAARGVQAAKTAADDDNFMHDASAPAWFCFIYPLTYTIKVSRFFQLREAKNMEILILGAGRMSQGLVYDFMKNEAITKIHIADRDPAALQAMQGRFDDPRLTPHHMAADDLKALAPLVKRVRGMVSAVPYDYNVALTELAIENGTHMVDLGGNNSVVQQQL
ncbi:MAG TPA: hypothetical protein ENJ10_04270, partial [Caldithrix abyssi]|nr:hypothetical protein [Caldithrix abyssi]